MSISLLKGVFPPMITPFFENGDVDYPSFVANINSWNACRLSGYLVNGSNSETAYLTESEKLKLVKLSVENAKPGRHIMAGTGMESLRETIRFTNKCAALGVQSALVLTPCYYDTSMTSPALVDFFTRVAEKSKIPILIYNVPKFTHVNIKADAVSTLADHPNIVGMKDSSGDVPQLATFLRVTEGKDFQVMVGTASAWYPALALGISAAVLALANCFPDQASEIQSAFDKGEYEKARKLYQILFPVNAAVTATYGIPGLKAACDYVGFRGGFVRSPLMQCTPDNRASVEQIIRDAEENMSIL